MDSLFSSFHAIQAGSIFLLYAGPDQILPIVSVLGGLMGILLIWWQRIINVIRRLLGSFRKSEQEVPTSPAAKIESPSSGTTPKQ
jgi:hypothetical protein